MKSVRDEKNKNRKSEIYPISTILLHLHHFLFHSVRNISSCLYLWFLIFDFLNIFHIILSRKIIEFTEISVAFLNILGFDDEILSAIVL